jgi:hypothetical protein
VVTGRVNTFNDEEGWGVLTLAEGPARSGFNSPPARPGGTGSFAPTKTWSLTGSMFRLVRTVGPVACVRGSLLARGLVAGFCAEQLLAAQAP